MLDESARAALAAISGRSADQRLFPSDGLVGDAVGITTTFQTATVLLVFLDETLSNQDVGVHLQCEVLCPPLNTTTTKVDR